MYTDVSKTCKMNFNLGELKKREVLVQKLLGFLLICAVLGTFIMLAYQIVGFLSAEIGKSGRYALGTVL